MSSIFYVRSTLTQAALDAFCQKYHIPDVVHPKLPAPNQSIHYSPAGKIGIYTRFFEFANFRIPLSQFLVDVLGYFRINLSQLSVIAAAKVSHFEILCRVHGYVSTVGLFHSLKHWNDSFFWVDASLFPFFVLWHTKKMVTRDPSPTADEFSVEACDFLATHQAPFQKFPESFLCLVEMDLFAFIHHVDPTKVRIGERQIEEGQVSLLESTKGRVIPLAGVDEQGDHHDNVMDIEPRLNEESGDAAVADQTEESDHAVQDEEVNIVVDEEVQAAAVDRPKGTMRKKKVVGGASGSNLPPKKLREDHDTSGDASASTAGKFLAALQGLLDHSMLAVEVGVTAVAIVPFVTSFVALTLERDGGGRTDFVSGPNLETRHPVFRSATSYNDCGLTVTAVVGTSSAPALGAGTEPVHASIFADSASSSAAGPDTAGPSYPRGTNISSDNFYVSKEMDSETLQHIYVPKWNVINDSAHDDLEVCRSVIDQLASPGFFSQLCGMNYDQLFDEFNVRAARQTCLSAEVRLRSEHNYRERKKFERKCQRKTDLLKEKDVEIASLKAQLSLKKAEATEAIRLRSQVSVAETAKAAREHIEAVRDEQIKVLSDSVAKLDSDLMGMDVHLDEEFYPCFLTTIAGWRWIISRGFRLAVMKCLQSPEYVAALGAAIGLAIDKGMQTGLVAGIDHGKDGRGLAEVAAYDPSVKERYVSALLALRNLDFNFLSQLESQKDASIADIMDSLRLEGPSAETPKVSRLQPAYEQLLLPIHRKEDNVVIGETSLSDSLTVVHDRVQKVKEGVPVYAATTTALSTTFAHTSSVPPISVTDYGMLYTETQPEASYSPKIIFKQETLETLLRTFQVRGRSFSLRSLSLYAPLPSAFVTSYGPSHLGPSFPPSSAWLASLLRYTRSPGLKLVLRTLEL
ncbi:hypothetical protein Tco_1182755 [Tanacetum coccineum]